MSWIDALYFTTETIATVGYGDFSFIDQPTWLRLWGIGLMFAGVITTAILVAFIADLLLSRRFAQSAGRRQVRHLRDHIIVVGLGSFGIRVVSDLKAAGHDVAVIERNEDNRYLSAAAELGVPVIFGDATLRQTLEVARPDEARAVAVLTQDDMVNIETGIVLHEMLGPRALPELNRPDVPIVLRVYDRALGAAVAQRFGFENVRSTVELATPWFIGAAMGLQVLGTFSVGQRSFMVGGVRVESCSELDGMRMVDLSTQTRVIAITRARRPRSGCTPAATPGSALATPPTSSGRTANCWTPCARGRVPSRPMSVLIQRRQVEARAGRIGDRGQPAVRRVLGVADHGAAVLLDERHRLVDVVGAQEEVPVRRRTLG